ncbi:hypothetical protein LTR09_006588 [Extremus antarcticus]|uniref:Amidohydrolase-related domain-containing protein n=1 Tax=Extremus antarcticus TaxID=702011 RepID=A0AAJ0DEB8_9PEZI|nr:hypothetical protein LTR09_006588 [Extremus antarcticus]
MSSHHGPSSENLARLAARIPKGTWDTHMHCVDLEKFPAPKKDSPYKPSSHTIQEARDFLSKLGIEKMVIVQPSFYGNDYDCTLDGLQQIGSKNGRGVVQFDVDTTSEDQLRKWHDQGVRGVRLNYKSVGTKLESTSLAAQLHKYAKAIRPFNWVMDLYIAMEDIPLLEPIVPELGDVKICIAHFGHPSDASISTAQSSEVMPGFASLIKLLKHDNFWVKVSGAYRLHRDPQHPLVKSIDWPHTRFEDLDVTQYLQELFNWCEAENVPIEQICVKNPEELFDAKS